MTAAWFGLLGVVVGGVISTLWNWLAVVRAELTDAMVGARLVDRELAGRQHRPSNVADTTSDPLWDDYRAALARVLGKTQWDTVSAAYAHRDDPDMTRELTAARDALAPLVAGKRYVVPQRWRNLFRHST
jgi:hypothetical protein